MANLNKKLSVKTLGWDKEKILEKVIGDKTKAHPIAIFYGQMTRLKKGETVDNAGEVRSFTGLRGMFKGVNVDTKEESASSVCYLPNVALDMIEGQWVEGERVEFAVQIFVKFDKASATSYVYEAEFLSEVSNNPLSAMEKLIAQKVPGVLSLTDQSEKTEEKPAKKAKAA